MYPHLAALLVSLTVAAAAAVAEDWPQFRGPGGDGVSSAAGVPLRWSETQNVRWKTAIPGRGHSSPVLRGDRIWLTTAVDTANKKMGHGADEMQVAEQVVLGVVCLDRTSGRLLYHKQLLRLQNPGPVHALNSYASPTPVVELGRLYCDFGTFGTMCVDAATGTTLWKRHLPLDHQVGPGSSPVLFDELLLLVRDGRDVQYVVALDKTSGENAWKTDRPPIDASGGHMKKAFSTPLMIQFEGQAQAIVAGAQWVVSYDPGTGQPIWRVCHGSGFSLVPRPVFGHGMVYACTGGWTPRLWAIRVDGRGDVSDSHVAWKATSQIPLMSSPLLVGQELYVVSDMGIASCFDALTGQMHWRERFGGNYAASPVYADGRIYFFNREGKATVLKPGRQFTRLAENQLDDAMAASPAFVDKSIFLRTYGYLYRIEE
jgi:outer membrane protein assembly factor BamB